MLRFYSWLLLASLPSFPVLDLGDWHSTLSSRATVPTLDPKDLVMNPKHSFCLFRTCIVLFSERSGPVGLHVALLGSRGEGALTCKTNVSDQTGHTGVGSGSGSGLVSWHTPSLHHRWWHQQSCVFFSPWQKKTGFLSCGTQMLPSEYSCSGSVPPQRSSLSARKISPREPLSLLCSPGYSATSLSLNPFCLPAGVQ